MFSRSSAQGHCYKACKDAATLKPLGRVSVGGHLRTVSRPASLSCGYFVSERSTPGPYSVARRFHFSPMANLTLKQMGKRGESR